MSARVIRRVGFIGLGDIGAPMARRLATGGYDLSIWARSPRSIDALAEPTAHIAPDPAALGRAVDFVGICVRNDDDVRSVVIDSGLLAAMRPRSYIAIHSTIHPESCCELARQADAVGVHVIDAPISGGRDGAERGDLTIMVGATDEQFAGARPVLATMGRPSHLGPLGSGQIGKLINNALMSANIGASAAALETASELGMDVAQFQSVLAASSGNSTGLFILRRSMASGRSGPPEILEKDIRHFADIRPRSPTAERLEQAAIHGVAALTATDRQG